MNTAITQRASAGPELDMMKGKRKRTQNRDGVNKKELKTTACMHTQLVDKPHISTFMDQVLSP